MYSQVENVPQTLGLDADTLEEISQLQENILETLRNELKKLKEPEVMGASIISTPTYEIGQDMTPLPSVRGSAMYLLRPIRVFSPISSSSKRITTRVVKAKVKKKSSVSTSSQLHHHHHRSRAKYDYKLRNYPRPWADAPTRKRTISTESLKVHVTTSHFSDMSVTSPVENFVPAGLTTIIGEDQPAAANTATSSSSNTRRENESESHSNQLLVRVESSERWRKSTMFNGHGNNWMVLNDHPLPLAAIKKLQNLKQINNNNQVELEINYMFEDGSQLQEKSTHKTVVFPAPIPSRESKKFVMSPRRKFHQSKNRDSMSLNLFQMTNLNDRNNNNDDNDEVDKEQEGCPTTIDKMKGPSSSLVDQNQAGMFCEMICKTLMTTKSIQVNTFIDQGSQTAPAAIVGGDEDDDQSFSSDGFELGLFVATLVDDLITKACKNCESRKRNQDSDNNNNNYKSNSSSCNPNSKPKLKGDKMDNNSKKRKSLASLSATKKKNQKTVVSNNKNNKLQNAGTSLKTNNNNKLTLKKSTNNNNNVVKQKSKNSSKPITQKNNNENIPNLQPQVPTSHVVDKEGTPSAPENTKKNVNSSHPSQLRVQKKSSQIITNTIIDKEITVNSESLGKDVENVRKKSLRRRKPGTKKICEDTIICDKKSSSELIMSKKKEEASSSFSNLEIKWLNPQLKNIFREEESHTSIQNFITITTTTTTKASSGQKQPPQQQTNCNQGLSIVEPSLKSGRKKRNIRMSYNPPDFEELFPLADSILAGARQLIPNLNLNNNTNNNNKNCQRNFWNSSHLTRSLRGCSN